MRLYLKRISLIEFFLHFMVIPQATLGLSYFRAYFGYYVIFFRTIFTDLSLLISNKHWYHPLLLEFFRVRS